jgi:ribonuclease-3
MNNKIDKFTKKINIDVKNKKIIEQVFVHKSYLNENPNFKIGHNERLEFLGDAVLELIVTEYLYKNFQKPEGELTNWRSALVKGAMISKVARKLGMEEMLYLSRGEQKSTGRARELILANTFEALIGAIYLDAGYQKAQEFVNKYLLCEVPEILKKQLYVDPKTKFQELMQSERNITPEYKVLDESGPDHSKKFSVGVYVNGELFGKGEGPSKQTAEVSAATRALNKYTNK